MTNMTNRDEEFSRLQSDPTQFQDNYEYNMNCCFRRILLANTLKCLADMRSKQK